MGNHTKLDWAELVSALRESSGLLQKQLAAEVGVDVQTVSRWERGISEPSKAQKGRLKDMLMLGRDPSQLPFVLQQLRVGKSVAVVNLVNGQYIGFRDEANLSGYGTNDYSGVDAVGALKYDCVKQAFHDIGGLAGILNAGVLGYAFTTVRNTRVGDAAVQTDASVLRFRGYEPIIVLHRHLIRHPETLNKVDIVFESDLPPI